MSDPDKERDVNRGKCEEVLLECLFKVTEIVVQSRLLFQPDHSTTQSRLRVSVPVQLPSPLIAPH